MTVSRRRRRAWVGACFAVLATLAGVGLLGRAVESSAPPVAPASTTSPVPTMEPSVVPRADTALAAVDTLTVKGRAPKAGYERSAYGEGWSSGDNCTTREVILRRDLDDVTVAGESSRAGAGNCGVVAGTLHDPYTGTTERLSATTLRTVEIDHVVALGDSWQKGAQQWESGEAGPVRQRPAEPAGDHRFGQREQG